MVDATGLSTVADKGGDVACRTREGAARRASDAAGRARQVPRIVRIAALAALAIIAAAVVRRLTSGTSAHDGGATGHPDDVSAQAPQPPPGAPEPAEYKSPPAAPPSPGDNRGEGPPRPPNEFPSQSGGTAA